MPKLIPAILTRDADEILEKARFLETIPEITEIQIDFEDGKFVPNRTALPDELRIFETRLKIEAHLMVNDPLGYFHNLQALGADSVILHFESFPTGAALKTAIRNAKTLGFQCGVAINPQTEISVFEDFIAEIDLVLLMSVYPGFQGREFIEESLDRIQTLRKSHKAAIIEVDGGINLDNFESVVAHGADRIVVGSGIWQTLDPKQTIYQFLEKLK